MGVVFFGVGALEAWCHSPSLSLGKSAETVGWAIRSGTAMLVETNDAPVRLLFFYLKDLWTLWRAHTTPPPQLFLKTPRFGFPRLARGDSGGPCTGAIKRDP